MPASCREQRRPEDVTGVPTMDRDEEQFKNPVRAKELVEHLESNLARAIPPEESEEHRPPPTFDEGQSETPD